MKSKRGLRLAVGGAVLSAVYLGLAASAMAGNEPLWVRQFGTSADDVALGVATDSAGNVYLTGSTCGPTGEGCEWAYAWVAKYDAVGHALWKRRLGLGDWDVASGVATDTAENVYLTGRTDGSLGGPNRGGNDAWVAKYNSAGRVLWKRQFGTDATDVATGLATDSAGNVYLTGYTGGSLGGANRGAWDAWVAKYDAGGHALWKRQLGTEEDDAALGVATDAAGNVYLTGYTCGSLGGAHRGGCDAWMAKYDAAGRVLWKRQFGTDATDNAFGVATDAKGNVYLTGNTDGSLGGANQGSYDAWVAKYDAAGRVLWKRQLGTEDWDEANGVATDAAGNVYLTGYTSGSLGGANRGSDDAWVAKYDAAGRVLWKRQLGSERDDFANGVATDATGNVYLSGLTNGSLRGANLGWNDAWLAKYSAQP